MSAHRQIPDSVRAQQAAASNPEVSAWVAANAGSGKTHVLAQRVIRLLLKEGVDPARILCITFTKAAAANMANRVFNTLREWIALDNATLDAKMREIGVGVIDASLRARARQLFAQALETPGGLKVQTIHAFCTHLLHLFPFEANVAARFAVLDEAEETQLLDRITLEVLLDASNKPDSPLGRALAIAIAAAADVTFRDLLNETIKARDKLNAWIGPDGDVDAAIARLSNALDVSPDDTLERVTADILNGPHLPVAQWGAVAALCAQGSTNDQKQCARLSAAVAANGDARVDAYLSVFLTDKGPRKSIITGGLAKRQTDLAARLTAEQARIVSLCERRKALAARERTRALVTVAHEVLGRFMAEKDRRGLLDYDDLIDKALALLNNTSAAWVHYKLDRGIDHVLIDEAQDTSPKQWAIVRALVAEFFAGAGAQTQHRTLFAVGDEKQSIFSFQGAVPHEFQSMRHEFDRLTRAVGQTLLSVNLDHSFRAGEILLAAVDTVAKTNDLYLSLVHAGDGYLDHAALPEAAPGLVEIWDTEKPAERREMLAWDAPFDTETESSPVVRFARRIAKSVLAWQRQGTRPGDVLILVRQRGAQFEAIIRALKDAGIAVAGADRLVLTEHIAVMDLIALADALLLPDDDLALATVLKCPLFGLDEEQLFRLAWKRKASLRAALAAKAGEDAKFAEANALLVRLSQWAKDDTPFAFYARLLNSTAPVSGRQRFLARLGLEAADALDEFLSLALDYERNETPTLQGFVAWLRAAKSEVKRDMDIVRDEVRVMTVHGAKGLEAPTVILADTTSPPEGFHPPRLLELPGDPTGLIWARRKDDDIGPMSDARAAALRANVDEYRRLLYVAMTRAAERLVICGVEGERGRPPGCWYDLVWQALKSDASEEIADDGVHTVWRRRKAPPETKTAMQERTSTSDALPQWLVQNAPKEPARTIPLMPSRVLDGVTRAPAMRRASHSANRNGAAILRGTLLHRAMQSLPDIAPAQRADALKRFLARAEKKHKLPRAESDAIAAQVWSLFDNPWFAELFVSGSRGEVPIVGRIGDRAVSGQIDRLAITADAVLIADYKTTRPAPLTLDDAIERHPDYVAQLALYRAVLMRLYPGRPVRSALLWTEVPLLMEIPTPALDASLAAVTGT